MNDPNEPNKVIEIPFDNNKTEALVALHKPGVFLAELVITQIRDQLAVKNYGGRAAIRTILHELNLYKTGLKALTDVTEEKDHHEPRHFDKFFDPTEQGTGSTNSPGETGESLSPVSDLAPQEPEDGES